MAPNVIQLVILPTLAILLLTTVVLHARPLGHDVAKVDSIINNRMEEDMGMLKLEEEEELAKQATMAANK